MGTDIETKFEKMGARVRINAHETGSRGVRGASMAGPVRIDIGHDPDGEFFDIRFGAGVEVQVLDARPTERHLLLLARDRASAGRGGEASKSKFLCGHDERSWFVAAVPEQPGVRDVQSAMDALKPPQVWESIGRERVPLKRRNRRRTAAFLRQGEWFFIPRPGLRVEALRVLSNEPIRRGGGKPHVCEHLCRVGGEQVYVSRRHPNGLTVPQYRALPEAERARRDWRVMVRDARVFAKGAIRHPDHKTIVLPYWHEVVMNTETRSRAMAHVAFLD
jgi:hypothetical protein